MPLNKAQLMEVPGGPGITGAVKSGTGIIISGDGTISVNPATNVTKLIAGTNITLNPPDGFGAVTITAASGGGGTITAVNAGTGLSGGGTSGSVTLSNSGVTGLTAGANISLSGSTGNVTITAAGGGGGGTITGVNAGTGLSGGGTSGTVTLSNSGVTSLTAGSNITLSGGTGAITISATGGGGGGSITGVTAGTGLSGGGTSGNVTLNNSGVTGLTAGANITLSGGTGQITISASGGGGGGGVPSFSAGSTGLTPATATVTAVTLGGVLNIANGGTGSSTKNFVDLSTDQQILGEKFFNAPQGIHAKGFNNLPASTSGFGFNGGQALLSGATEGVLGCQTAPGKFFKVNAQGISGQSDDFIRYIASRQLSVETPLATTTAAWTTVSDQRLKTNVANFPSATVDQYKDAFKQLQFVTYKWDSTLFSYDSYPTYIGLIAQDVEIIEPDFVDTLDLTFGGDTPASPFFVDTKVLNSNLTVITQVLLQRVIQELDDLKNAFDTYVLAHP